MPTVIVTGGTGMIGRRLSDMLTDRGYQVIILSRNPKGASDSVPGARFAYWDPNKLEFDQQPFKEAHYIINLAGAGIAEQRWNARRKQEIVDSRVNGSKTIAKALKEVLNNIVAVVSSSAIGWYGEDRLLPSGRDSFTEEMPAASDFLGRTCKLWEESIEEVREYNKRLVKIRTGIVLSRDGGALPELSKTLRFGVASILASGRQTISWIHIDDLCRLFVYAMENEDMSGAYNGVASFPVDNKTLVLSVAEKVRNNFYIPVHVPAFAVKLAVGGMSVEVLKSLTVNNEKFKEAGYQFLYPTLTPALEELYGAKHA